ncbi:unnamed protein product [Nippostrongylus brasiliensis]|uniref:Uncharacterized protein n=1 Tax=Nippostrongylus brasiliensis TaxID=27835 RepID=A0A0N4XWM1_NIPBR|nr:unnamed protein product [Nippostrongylus brasiliensis]
MVAPSPKRGAIIMLHHAGMAVDHQTIRGAWHYGGPTKKWASGNRKNRQQPEKEAYSYPQKSESVDPEISKNCQYCNDVSLETSQERPKP